MKKIKYLFLILVAMCTATSCSEDDLSPDSIFDTTAPQRNEFDKWILTNYTTPYNIDLKYRFEDIESASSELCAMVRLKKFLLCGLLYPPELP